MFRQRANAGRLLAALLLAVLGITGCSQASRPNHGTFLTDYSKLQKSKDAQGHVYFTHSVATPVVHDHPTYAVSVSYFPVDTRFTGLGSETQSSILSYLDHAIRQRLQDKAVLASRADEAEVQLDIQVDHRLQHDASRRLQKGGPRQPG